MKQPMRFEFNILFKTFIGSLFIVLALQTPFAKAQAPAASPASATPSNASEESTLGGFWKTQSPPPSTPPAPSGSDIREMEGSAERVQVYLLWAPTSDGITLESDITSVLTRLAMARLNELELVKLKTTAEMPDVPKTIAQFGDLETLDRVSLINIKNITGFDGMIRVKQDYAEDHAQITITYFDFRNGDVFRKRFFDQQVDASIFQMVEDDLVEFATKIRRSYRVTLRVESNPSESDVLLNGVKIGKTPLLKELKAGQHQVTVTREGFKKQSEVFDLKDGDALLFRATLYNPIAARFLNAPPGLRLDSRQFSAGYRYVYLGLDRPALEHLHLFSLEGVLRINSFDIGLFLNSGGAEAENPTDSFLGSGQGLQKYDHTLLQVGGLFKYIVWEKYSYLSIRACTSQGFTYATTESSGLSDTSAWSYSLDLYGEIVSRLFRSDNFSMELQFNLGVSYLGELPFLKKSVDIFGEGPEEQSEISLIGPMAGANLRFNFFNDIF